MTTSGTLLSGCGQIWSGMRFESTFRGMEVALERIDPGPASSWHYHLRGETRFEFGWHYHPEHELTLITAGGGQRFVGDSIEFYSPGDLTLIGAGLPHAYVSASDSNFAGAVVAQFRHDFLGETFFEAPEFSEVGLLLERAARGLVFTVAAATRIAPALTSLSMQDRPERTVGLLTVLISLARERNVRLLSSPAYRRLRDASENSRIKDVCRFVASSYHERVRLSDAAQIANMTPSSFSRYFRRAMGRTFTAYITELRLAAACRLLVDSEASIASIATDCGFDSLTNFNRRFRSLKGTTPREYRAMFRGEPSGQCSASRRSRRTPLAPGG